MREKIVYTLCSRGLDYYSTMARVSVLSVRICNPQIDVELLVDRTSLDALQSVKDPILTEVDGVTVCDIPSGDGGYRSRYLKTSARRVVEGSFLMLDCDILVRRDLSDLFNLSCDVAGAPNHSRDDFRDQLWGEDLDAVDAMGWAVRPGIYVNTGVLFFGNTEVAHAFGERWHEYWLSSFRETGRHQDQPAFNAALCDVNLEFVELSHGFNAQVRKRPEIARGASIWHFYSSNGADITNVFDTLVQSVLGGRPLSRAQVQKLVESDRLYWPHRQVAAWLITQVTRVSARLRPLWNL